MFLRSLVAALLLAGCAAPAAQAPTIAEAAKPAVKHTPERFDPRAYVKRTARAAGYDRQQWRCLDEIIHRESRWNPKADNPDSTAFGLFQMLRLDPATDLAKMTRLGLKYIHHRYGDACEALAFHNKNGWY